MRLPKDWITGMYTKPRIFLCNPDKERICQLETTNTSATLKFNSYSELSFEVGRTYNNIVTGETLTNPHYDKIEAVRLVEVDGLGYFEIQGPELVSDGIKEAKNVTAYSLEYTLSTKYLSNFLVNTGTHGSIEVTYAENNGDINKIQPVTLYNQSNTSLSLLHLVLQEVYGWQIGHVDASLQTLSRQFEVDRESVYDFLMNEVCEKFNCYIVFNTINNTINVYAESLTAKFIGDGAANTFIISPPFTQIGTVSVDGYKTTRWEYNVATGAITLEDTPVAGAHIEVVDGALTEWATDVFVSFDNLSQEINVNYDADAIKTKLTVTYGDDGDIREVNLGLPYLTDLSYYYTVDWMGQDLYDAYTAYIQKSNDSQLEYTNNSQEILKINDQIYYEENRLSLEYSLVQSVGPTTVGTYYVRQENYDGTFYYKEVSLPNEYDANENYYSNETVNVTEEKVENLYAVLKKYFNNEDTNDNSGDTKITSWKTDLIELQQDFEFMETYTLSYLLNELSKVDIGRIGNADIETAIGNFISEMWAELGRTPLRELYLKPYQEIKETNIKAGWANKDNENYPYYYPVLLYISSIEAAIASLDAVIGDYEKNRKEFYDLNAAISDQLLMHKNFTERQLIRLSAFLREDELHIEDIIETSQDDLSSSFKVKQDAMESGRIELQKLCQPQLQFSMTMANIYALPEFEPIIDQFQLGKVIKVALRPNYIKQSRLMQVNINFDDFSDFSCEFGELTSLRSQSDIHADLLKNAITAGKSVATNSSHWTRGSDAATALDLKIQQGLLDATTQIKAMDGKQGVTIDKYGIHLRSIDEYGNVDPKQGWIVNNQFLYSDDGFKSTKAVFGEYTFDGQSLYGVLADAIVGRLLIGSQIKLENNDATMTFDNNGLLVTNGMNSFNVNPNDKSLLSISKADNKIFYIDDSGVLHISGDGAGLDITSNSSITGLSSTIEQTSDKISLVVRDGEIDAASIVTAINNGEGSVMISADHVDVSGIDVNLKGQTINIAADDVLGIKSPYFSVDTDGHMTATRGTIGGWTIGDADLYYGDDYATSKMGMGTSDTELAFWAGRSDTNTKFSVTADGALYSISGKIGGWKITDTTIQHCNPDADGVYSDGVAMKVGGTYAFVAGSSDLNSNDAAKFRVTHAGKLYATGVEIDGKITADAGSKIGPWTLSSTTIRAGGSDGNKIVAMQAPNASGKYAFAVGGTSHDSYADCPFKVDFDGKLYATDAQIDGKITAGSGSSVGGWTITNTNIEKQHDAENKRFFICSNPGPEEDGYGYDSWIAAGIRDSADDAWSWPFYVLHDGTFKATKAKINGTITTDDLNATGGTIGGWKIEDGYLEAPATAEGDVVKLYPNYIQWTDADGYSIPLRWVDLVSKARDL